MPSSDLLPALDRCIARAQANRNPEDKHHIWALRRAKKAVQESLESGSDVTLGALHTLRGVGHWVVEQIREQLEGGGGPPPKRPRQAAEMPPTPQSFSWWYLDRSGKGVRERNSAESSGPLGAEQFRVSILHSSGRMEKAWLPESKAPPQGPAPADRNSSGGA